MHDAAEAFVGDVTRPLKQLLPGYKSIEANVESAICRRFQVQYPIPEAVKNADLRVLAAEQAQIMPLGTNAWAQTAGVVPADITVKSYSPSEAKSIFLERFMQLHSAQGN
jgi:5'-deoxynucleotidase YfbR-like HD superfamily hydrolase